MLGVWEKNIMLRRILFYCSGRYFYGWKWRFEAQKNEVIRHKGHIYRVLAKLSKTHYLITTTDTAEIMRDYE